MDLSKIDELLTQIKDAARDVNDPAFWQHWRMAKLDLARLQRAKEACRPPQ